MNSRDPILLPPGTSQSSNAHNSKGGKQLSKKTGNIGKLSDPSREELRNGPNRAQLPEKVQQMPRKDTVCRFCGVSYLVFSEIKQLEQQLEEKSSQLEELKATNSNQHDTDEECNLLRESVKQLQEANHKLKFEHESKSQSAASANELLKQQEAENKTLRKVCQDHGSLVKQLECENRNLKDFRQRYQTQAAGKEAQYKKQIEVLQAQHKEQRIQDQNRIASMEKELSNLRDTLRQSKQMFLTSKSQVSAMKQMCQEALGRMRAQLVSSRQTINAKLEQELSCHKTQVEQLEAKLDESSQDHQGKLAIAQQKLKISIAQLSVAQSHLNTERRKREGQEQTCNTLKEQLESAQQKYEELLSSNTMIQDQATLLKHQSEQDTIQLKENHKQLEELRAQLMESKQKVEDLEKRNQQQNKTMDNSVNEKVKTLEARVKELESKLVDGRRALDDILQKSNGVNTQKQHLQEQLTKILKVVEDYKQKELENEESISQLKHVNTQLETQVKTVERAKHDALQHAQNVQVLKEQLEQQQLQLDQANSCTNTLKEMNEKLQAAQIHSQESETALKVQIKQLENSIVSTKAQMDVEKQAALKRQQDAMQIANERQRSQSTRHATAIMELRKQLDAAKKTIAESSSLQSELIEWNTKLQQNKEQFDKLNQLCESYKIHVEELNNKLRNSKAVDIQDGANLDMGGLEEMERYLIKLSNVVRQKEDEIKSLQQTIKLECEERTRLQIALQDCSCAS